LQPRPPASAHLLEFLGSSDWVALGLFSVAVVHRNLKVPMLYHICLMKNTTLKWYTVLIMFLPNSGMLLFTETFLLSVCVWVFGPRNVLSWNYASVYVFMLCN